MRKVFYIMVIFCILFVFWLQPFDFGEKTITIPKNATAREAAQILAEYRVVRMIPEFLFWLKVLGKEGSIRSGEYHLLTYKNPIYVIQKLIQGVRSDITITIPEGLTVYEVADIFYKRKLIDDRRTLIRLCHDRNFIKSLGLNVPTLEGYLFPDTYSFEANESVNKIIRRMVENFLRQLASITTIPADSLQNTIIIASLIEREAKHDEERPIIAQVFFNRLKSKRPLESCATVIYAYKQKNPDTVITYLRDKDLKVESPYNTYLHLGLPPGPICSPGLISLKAALNPAPGNYLYFVSKGDGYHHFSKTYKEHLLAKEQYRAKK